MQNKNIVAVVSDLFFSVKISEAAKRAGVAVDFVKDRKEVLAKAKSMPALIIFDLNFDNIQPLELIQELKSSSELKHIKVIGYLSHVQNELKLKAQETGCDTVLARSAFSQNLPEILKRYAGPI